VRFGWFSGSTPRASTHRAGRHEIDCGQDRLPPQTLHDWVKKAEVDRGQGPAFRDRLADKLKALERE